MKHFKFLILFFYLTKNILGTDTVPGILLIKEKTKATTGISMRLTNHSITELHQRFKPKQIKRFNIPEESNNTSARFRLTTSNDISLLEFEASDNLDEIANEYKKHDAIEYAEPLYKIKPFSSTKHNSQQYYLDAPELKNFIQLPEKHPIVVAIIDSGINFDHPDLNQSKYINNLELKNNIDDDANGYIDDESGYNFAGYYETNSGSNQNQDPSGHGTHLAGIIAGRGLNNDSIRGINSNTQILNIRIFDDDGNGNQLDAAMAIRYAADNGARVINCSWGFFKYNSILKDAIDYATSKGVIIIAAVGNSNTNIPEYPAAFENVIGIGAVNTNLSKSSYASFGTSVQYVMYGDDIYSCYKTPAYYAISGTSQAAAIVTGMTAKILSFNSNLSAPEISNLFKNATKDLSTEGYDYKTGNGIIDGDRLLTQLNWTPAPQEKTTKSDATKKLNLLEELSKENPFILAISGIVGALLISILF